MTEIVYKKLNSPTRIDLQNTKKKLLEKYVGCCFPLIEKPLTLVYNEYGKQSFLHYPLKFNISHSGEYLVCAFSKKEIGVDIQRIKDIDLKIAKRFFAKNEYSYINSMPENEKVDAFFRLWVLKESFIKAVGKGMFIPLNSFEIDFTEDSPKVLCKTIKGRYSFIEYDIFEGYKMAVCINEA